MSVVKRESIQIIIKKMMKKKNTNTIQYNAVLGGGCEKRERKNVKKSFFFWKDNSYSIAVS